MKNDVMAFVRRIDLVLLGAVLVLVSLSTLLVWSATIHRDALTGGDTTAYLRKQMINVAAGLVLMVGVVATNHRWVRLLTPVVYLGAVVGLVLVLVMGSTINGSKSWVVLGPVQVQPSELAKLAVVIAMALVLAERSEGRWQARVSLGDVIAMILVAAVPIALVLLQPDLGTTLVLGVTVFCVLAAAGTPRRWLALLALIGASAATIVVAAGVLKQYQINRFMAFTDPSLDPRGAGYNVQQARIAIGDGGIFGQGLFQGSQVRAGFVPEQQTDFIFTVVGEELGLVGSLLVIGLIGVVLWRGLRIAARTDDLFGRVAAAGIVCWLGIQSFQNIGMCLGIMPVTGVPLPFLSYGGSSMIATLLAVGLLLGISGRSRRTGLDRSGPLQELRSRDRLQVAAVRKDAAFHRN
ncbi:rod shape-determining protein RodA [Nocardioides sp.]|uniref:rod shape-determining protein RodA n=1 Tax=Nocardioides sp. TaxID=35761 RepID=UPI0019BEACDF|nr:rod shape-determining protein RodA [Nocardioides sp.]MBC7276900.1 rod shape-determining protein RodA [Nocardioides sp.]